MGWPGEDDPAGLPEVMDGTAVRLVDVLCAGNRGRCRVPVGVVLKTTKGLFVDCRADFEHNPAQPDHIAAVHSGRDLGITFMDGVRRMLEDADLPPLRCGCNRHVATTVDPEQLRVLARAANPRKPTQVIAHRIAQRE